MGDRVTVEECFLRYAGTLIGEIVQFKEKATVNSAPATSAPKLLDRVAATTVAREGHACGTWAYLVAGCTGGEVSECEQRVGLKVGRHTFRHSFATRLLDSGHDICTVQECRARWIGCK